MPSLTAITIQGTLDWTGTFRFMLVVMPQDSVSDPVFLNTGVIFTPMHKSTEAWIDHPPPSPSPNEHACQNVSQEMPTSIGTAAVGGLRLVHPSLWGNRCCHWFTLQACESKSTSVTTYSKELWAAAEQKAQSEKSRCKTRYSMNPENWQMESIWFELQQIYLTRRKKKKEKRDRQQLTECPTYNPQWLPSDTLHTSFHIKKRLERVCMTLQDFWQTSNASATALCTFSPSPPWPTESLRGSGWNAAPCR